MNTHPHQSKHHGIRDDVAANIRNERRGAIDRNPDVPCHVCESTSYDWDTWQVKYSEITPETTLRCDSCWGDLIEQAKIERKRERNQNLTAYQS